VNTRILFVDDSGKPDAAHQSGAVVIAGFAVDSDLYPVLSRRVLGAKGHFFPARGRPSSWEIKSTDFIKPNPWRRAKNRKFLAELVRILGTVGATTYSATIVKSHLIHPMTLATTMPLQLQCLVEHFDAECKALGAVGMIVSDWSSHQYDQHASTCVASFVASKHLNVHPAVYYASSHANEAIQVADLIAAIRRRSAEGDANMVRLESTIQALHPPLAFVRTTLGHTYSPHRVLI
jgi:hypothetical protein